MKFFGILFSLVLFFSSKVAWGAECQITSVQLVGKTLREMNPPWKECNLGSPGCLKQIAIADKSQGKSRTVPFKVTGVCDQAVVDKDKGLRNVEVTDFLSSAILGTVTMKVSCGGVTQNLRAESNPTSIEKFLRDLTKKNLKCEPKILSFTSQLPPAVASYELDLCTWVGTPKLINTDCVGQAKCKAAMGGPYKKELKCLAKTSSIGTRSCPTVNDCFQHDLSGTPESTSSSTNATEGNQ